jgi:molybdate transport system permease protein
MMSKLSLPRWLGVPTGLLLGLLLVPLVALAWRTGWAAWLAGWRHPLTLPAVTLSAWTSLLSTLLLVVLGTPLAWTIVQAPSRWSRVLQALVQLPMVLPPAVAGLALLLVFGRQGLAGPLLQHLDWQVAFSAVAVVLAQVFVAAPLYVQAAVRALGDVDPQVLAVARTLGATPTHLLLRVALPLAGRGLAAGALLAWARALGEFGATLLFAGNLAGRTQTVPLAIYTALETDPDVAQALALLLLVIAGAVLGVAHVVGHRRPPSLRGES